MIEQKSTRPRSNEQVNRRIRLVHLVSTMNCGGLERVVLDLVRNMPRDVYDFRVVCLGELGALASELAQIDVAVESLDVLGTRAVHSMKVLCARLRELRPDILHTHNPVPHLFGVFAGRLARVPVIVHTKHGRNYPELKKKVVLNRIASWLTDVIVPVSIDAERVATKIEMVRPDKLHLIHNGIDVEAYPFAERRPPEAWHRAIHVARLINVTKDQESLLQAARIVADAYPVFQLQIVGDGPDRAFLENLTRELGIGGHVEFLGYRSDVSLLLQGAGVFVLPSISEGLSLTLLEAMASGLPVIATSVGGNPEVVVEGVTGLLVPSKSPELLAQALLRVLRVPELGVEMGRAGRQRVETHFDFRVAAQKYEALYQNFLLRKNAAMYRTLLASDQRKVVAAKRDDVGYDVPC